MGGYEKFLDSNIYFEVNVSYRISLLIFQPVELGELISVHSDKVAICVIPILQANCGRIGLLNDPYGEGLTFRELMRHS